MNQFLPPLNKEHLEKNNKIVKTRTLAKQKGIILFSTNVL